MSVRYQNYTRGDTPGFVNGDHRWIGIDSTRDRDKVQPGLLYRGENSRVRTGTVRQRAGTQMPADFNPVGGFGAFIAGSGIFRDPLGLEVLLVAPANDTKTYVLAFEKDPYTVAYSTTTNAPSNNNGPFVEFAQTFTSIQLFRINPTPPFENLVWNGNTPTTDADRWQKTVLSAEGKDLVPAAWFGEPWGERLITYYPYSGLGEARDLWFVSDILDYTSYDKVYQRMRTNAAESDIITSIKAFHHGSAVIYKDKSIHLATDNQTYPFSAAQRKISDLGALGVRMPVDVGGDQIFLSQPSGFYRLREVIEQNIISLPLPISEPIQRVIDQINWGATAVKGCSAALDNYAFFAVCLGPTAQRNNCILVYNTQVGQWESAGDTWRDPSFGFDRLHALNFGGVRRLCAVDNVNGIIYLLYEGVRDELRSGSFSVPFKMETRGYIGDDPLQFKRFSRVRIAIAGWDPLINVTALSDGVNEEFLLTEEPITKDNTQFYTHGKATFDPEVDAENAPYREDYSVADFDNFAIEDFEELPEGEISLIPGTLFSSINDDLQECTEALMVRQIGRWGAIRIENDDGYMEVKGITVEGIPGTNAIRTAA